MAEIVPFRPREIAADLIGDVSTSPTSRTFDRARFRAQVEAAAHACFDMASACIAVLDRLDGDPDFEPDPDGEDDGTAEPAMSALVTLSQIRWIGFDGGAA